MILPNCTHEVPTKSNLDAVPAPSTGWIFTCLDHFQKAIRANVMLERDLKTQIARADKLHLALLKIQKLESDLNDCTSAPGVAFIRCGCGRLKLQAMYCRGCER